MIYRHELKYLINERDLALVRMRLAPLLQRDRHVNADGLYTVRSLYFDDYLNSSYNNKYNGVLDRQKYRIRIYNGSDRVINLERKIKWSSYVYKQSASLSRQQVVDILCGNYDNLLRCDDPLHKVFYHECRTKMLRPRVIVDYEREPYFMGAGSVRVTFDMHIRAATGGWDIFDPRLGCVEVMNPGLLVMEVKYSEFLPSMVQRALPQNAADYSAVSKFVLACDKTLYYRHVDN